MSEFAASGLIRLSDNLKSKIQNQKWFFALAGMFLTVALGHGGEAATWETEWQQTLAAARKEGQVTVYIYRSAPDG